MNRVSWLLALAAVPLRAQQGPLSVGFPDTGMQVQFVTRLNPPATDPSQRLPGAVFVGHGRAHHLIDDREHKRCFGYDLALEPGREPGIFRLRIEPLNSQPAISCGSGEQALGLPRYPIVDDLKAGDTVALDLLVNAATGQKIVDYLTIRQAIVPKGAEARDITLSDVQLRLDRPRVFINGKLFPASANFQGGTAASVDWIYIEGRGRYIFSLLPNPRLGFKKAGAVTAKTITLRDGATELRIECASEPTPAQGLYNLYVVHEPAWPPPSKEAFTIGSADNAEWVVGK